MAKLCIEFGSSIRVLFLVDNLITVCKSYQFTEDVLDRVFEEVYPLNANSLYVSLKLVYTRNPDGQFVLDKINTYDGKPLFGVLPRSNLISLQNFAKNLGLNHFKLVSNTAVYAHLLDGKIATVLDEYTKGMYLVAPFAGSLQDYVITTDIMLEEVAKLYPQRIKSQSFVNMLDTELGSLEFSAYYSNYTNIAEDVRNSIACLLATPLVADSTTIRVDEDIAERVTVTPSVEVEAVKEQPEEPVRKAEVTKKPKQKAKGGRVSSAFLVLLIVLVFLSTVVNYKMPEDIALISQVNGNLAATVESLGHRRTYMNNMLEQRNGSELSYNYVYTLVSHLQIDGILADVKYRTTHYEITFLLKSQADTAVIQEKLGALLEIEEGASEVLTKDGVSLFKVSFVHKLN